ncbi:hypothetical protein ScPMuIL_010360 [Solemya velum]
MASVASVPTTPVAVDQDKKAEFPNVKEISAVATKGRNGYPQWVTAYSIRYSIDGATWAMVKNNNGQDKVFSGNNDEDTLVENFLPTPIKAMFIRIQPTKWYTWVSMRFGVSGCDTSGPLQAGDA